MKKKSFTYDVDTTGAMSKMAGLAKKAFNSVMSPKDACCKRELFMSPVFPTTLKDEHGKDVKQKRGDRVGIQISVSAYAYDEKLLKSEPLSGGIVSFAKSCIVSDFGYALRMLKAGEKVCRAGWNGKGMWLSLSCDGTRNVEAKNFWSHHNARYAAKNGGAAKVLPCITMKTATGEILMGWLASQTDMLAEDWMVVEKSLPDLLKKAALSWAVFFLFQDSTKLTGGEYLRF